MNALFVANKPIGISSNFFLSKLKRKYNVKKAGFSGTLDPFASGSLIIAFGDYTKFFRFLNKTPKIYKATLWLGAKSKSLDNENIQSIKNISLFDKSTIEMIVKNLQGELTYTPPKFSAKKINGKRAYEMARNDEEFELKECKMNIYESKIINYSHPFLSILLSVSEGAYIRSYAELFSKKLGCDITLSALNRVSEGKFKYENEKFLNPFEYLNLKENFYLGDLNDLILGKKLNFKNFKFINDGKYLLNLGEFYSIIEIENNQVKYLWNRIKI
ncbi:tRNA pseudouridine(55) synthase TruB [Campylobacter ureolyticus]|uniref:tRNA pseudouridine(55) synthase TruB n=1 Tax=Campylobacter ureolyticus TaxID=827 RepID=UPI0022B3CCF6|nr:tRNA pseudouridine(55) synthase TruB [Campylobacter ureolyticus]MCZ6174190.1 tRNA pseudouridine(55) synthase TruB [Campylobacter ureolyticus]